MASETQPKIDFAPFDCDGRVMALPTMKLYGTQPMALSYGAARRSIEAFISAGHSTHSAAGATLWVILTWCQYHRKEYTLQAQAGFGYHVKLTNP